MDRRTFIQAKAAAGAGLLLGNAQSSRANEAHPVIEPPSSPTVFKLASREFLIPGETIDQKLDNLERWGFNAIELDGNQIRQHKQEIRTALRGRDLEVCMVSGGYQGVLVHQDPNQRHEAKESIKEMVSLSAVFQPIGLIVVPAFVGQSTLYMQYAQEALLNDLPELAEHAWQNGMRIILEPLNHTETWYIRFLAQAASICKQVNHPGLAMMGDFFHMGIEEPCDYGAILSSRQWIKHIHLASRQRFLPGQDERDFRPGFRALKEIGYSGYCSFECFPQGDVEVEIPKSVEFLRNQWLDA